MRPEQAFPRRDLAVTARRPPTQEEVTILGPGRIVAECQVGTPSEAADAAGPGAAAPGAAAPGAAAPGTVDLALAESALTGLLAWLEAAPPGSHLDVAH
jgi:hypothetical protein